MKLFKSSRERLNDRRRSAIAYLRDNPDHLIQIYGSLWEGNGYYCALGAVAKNLGVKDERIHSVGYSVVEDKLKIVPGEIYCRNDSHHTFSEIADYLENKWFPAS